MKQTKPLIKYISISALACLMSACSSNSSDSKPAAQLPGLWQPKGIVCDPAPANAVQTKSVQSVTLTNTTVSNTGSGSGRQNIASNSAGCNEGPSTANATQIVSFNGQSVSGDSVQPMVGEQKKDGVVSVPVDASAAGCEGLTKTARVVYEKVL